MIPVFVAAYLVLVGMMVGSFVNLAMDRLPRRESVIRPRSHCRACGRRLNTVDLLPVLGYLIRRGRCATCGSWIGLTSPIVEAGLGACVAVPIVLLGLWPGALAGLGLLVLVSVALVWLALLRRPPLNDPDSGSGMDLGRI